MYIDAKPNKPPSKPFPFRLQLGKLYQYDGETEVLRTIIELPEGKIMEIENFEMQRGDAILLLKKPIKFHGYFYCKILNKEGFIGYFLWDEFTYDKFSPFRI